MFYPDTDEIRHKTEAALTVYPGDTAGTRRRVSTRQVFFLFIIHGLRKDTFHLCRYVIYFLKFEGETSAMYLQSNRQKKCYFSAHYGNVETLHLFMLLLYICLVSLLSFMW